MARKPRFNLPGYPQHVIQRGIDRQACFFSVADYKMYLNLLQESAEVCECHVHAYVLMTNHVHMLITPQAPFSVPHMMQRLGQRYVRYVNRRYHRTGTLWDGRYKAGLVDSDRYLLACMRYIEMNPVRAGIVEHPAEYAWSSYRCNALGKPAVCIMPHALYLMLHDLLETRMKVYRGLFELVPGQGLLDDIRDTLNQELVLGSRQFKVQIEAMINRQTEAKKKGRPVIENIRNELY